MTTHPGEDPLQVALAAVDSANQRHMASLGRLRHLTTQHRALLSTSRAQAAEIADGRAAVDAARRNLLMVEAAAAAQWEWDVPSGRVDLGSRWNEMLGEPAGPSQWQMKELMARVHPDDVGATLAAFERVAAAAVARYVVELRVSGRQGWIWIESLGLVTERDEQGQPVKLTGCNSDITGRRALYTQLEQACTRAENDSRTKGEALAKIGREVRTAVDAMAGFIRLLQQSDLAPEQRRQLALIANASGLLPAMLDTASGLSTASAASRLDPA